MESTFTICFESPFWVGIIERHDGDEYWIGRLIFGGEPSNAEVWEFAKTDFSRMRITLVRKGDQPSTLLPRPKPGNIKKAQREAKRDLARGFSSYTHDAMQEQLMILKAERADTDRKRSELKEQEQFLLKQQKKKEKHKGH